MNNVRYNHYIGGHRKKRECQRSSSNVYHSKGVAFKNILYFWLFVKQRVYGTL